MSIIQDWQLGAWDENYFSLVPVVFEIFPLVALLPLVRVLAHVAELEFVGRQLNSEKVPTRTDFSFWQVDKIWLIFVKIHYIYLVSKFIRLLELSQY